MFLHIHLTLRLRLCIHPSRNSAVIQQPSSVFLDKRNFLTLLQNLPFLQAVTPSTATFLYVSILPALASLPNSPDSYGPASTEHTSTSSLNPAFSFSSSPPPPHCWQMTYRSCHQGSAGVWLIERARLCVSVDSHSGSWPSSWILSLLLNSDSQPPNPLSLPPPSLSALPA